EQAGIPAIDDVLKRAPALQDEGLQRGAKRVLRLDLGRGRQNRPGHHIDVVDRAVVAHGNETAVGNWQSGELRRPGIDGRAPPGASGYQLACRDTETTGRTGWRAAPRAPRADRRMGNPDPA